MYFSINGCISHIGKNFLAVANNGLSYQIFVSRISTYSINQNVYLFLYRYKHEDEEYLIGFDSLKDKDFFLLLLEVNGIGPKTALNILSKVTFDEFKKLIFTNDIKTLSNLPGIGKKTSLLLYLSFKDKYKNAEIETNKNSSKLYNEVVLALQAMGFKKADIIAAISEIDFTNLDKESAIKAALKNIKKYDGR